MEIVRKFSFALCVKAVTDEQPRKTKICKRIHSFQIRTCNHWHF